MSKQHQLSLTLMIVGAVVGMSAIAWYLVLNLVAATYWALILGHLLVIVGLTLRWSVRWLFVSLVLIVLMWWPAVFGERLWGHGA